MDTWYRETGVIRDCRKRKFFEPNAQVVKIGKARKRKKLQKCARINQKLQEVSKNARFLSTLERATCAFGAMWTNRILYLARRILIDSRRN